MDKLSGLFQMFLTAAGNPATQEAIGKDYGADVVQHIYRVCGYFSIDPQSPDAGVKLLHVLLQKLYGNNPGRPEHWKGRFPELHSAVTREISGENRCTVKRACGILVKREPFRSWGVSASTLRSRYYEANKMIKEEAAIFDWLSASIPMTSTTAGQQTNNNVPEVAPSDLRSWADNW